jgi:hypothetical protein
MRKSLMISLTFTGIALLPAFAIAAGRPAAMDNCVNAFVESLAKHTTGLKLRGSRFLNTGVEGPTGELVLIATDVHDNRTVGRALCRLDSRGQVVELLEAPPHSLPMP